MIKLIQDQKPENKLKLGSTNEMSEVQPIKYKNSKVKKKALASPEIKIDLVSVKADFYKR